MKKLIALFSIIILTVSCSKNDDTIPVPALPQLELKGLFKIDTNFSNVDQNFLFENNKIFIAYEDGSIHQELVVGSNLLDDSVAFTYNSSTNKITFTYLSNKWEGTYQPSTGKIVDGVVKESNGTTIVGSFTGQKYIPATTGANLFIGHWKGNFGIGTGTPNNAYNLIIENGSLVVSSGSENTLDNDITNRYGLSLNAPAINDKTITAVFQYIGANTFSMEATYNPTTKKLEGTWGSGLNTSGGGTVVFESQNIN